MGGPFSTRASKTYRCTCPRVVFFGLPGPTAPDTRNLRREEGVVRNGLCVRGFNLLVGGLWLSGTTRHALFCREKRRRFSTPVAHGTARLRGFERLEHQGTIRQGNCSPATGRICKERRLMENMKKRLN